MVAIPFPVTSAPGARRQESAGRLINAYAVKTEQGAPTPLRWTRSPGLRELITVAGQAGYGLADLSSSAIGARGSAAFGRKATESLNGRPAGKKLPVI